MADLPTAMPNSPLHESIPRTFTKFTNLPPEIRWQIWNYSFPGPRVMRIMGNIRGANKATQCFAESSDHPILLYVCQESRTLALKRYQCAFEPHLRHPIYFDPSQDVLLMQNENILDMFFERSRGSIASDITLVQVIAVDLVRMGRRSPSITAHSDIIGRYLGWMSVAGRLMNAAARFGNLSEIILLKPQQQWDLQDSFHSDDYQENMRRHYLESVDQYALKRKEFLDDDEGNIPITTISTAEDFWNRYSYR